MSSPALPGGYQLPAPSRATGSPKGRRKPAQKKKRARAAPQAAPAVSSPSRKPSGAQFEQARKARRAAEQARHAARLAASGKVSVVEPCRNPERAHLYEIDRLLNMQFLIETDSGIPNEEKARLLMGFAQAMSKLQTQAELERRIEELEAQRAEEAEQMLAAQSTVEVARLQMEAERKDLDNTWRKLNEERARFAAERAAQGAQS